MLTKRKDLMASKTRTVKKLGLTIAIVASVCSASSAQAGNSSTFDRTITAKFSAADLTTDAGVEKVYKKLERKAKRFCISDAFSLDYFGESVNECVDDLMSQFVVNAGVDSLSAYHMAQTSPVTTKKYALKES